MYIYVFFFGRLFLINRRKIDLKYIYFVVFILYIWDKFLLWFEYILVRVGIFFLSVYCVYIFLFWYYIVDFCFNIF